MNYYYKGPSESTNPQTSNMRPMRQSVFQERSFRQTHQDHSFGSQRVFQAVSILWKDIQHQIVTGTAHRNGAQGGAEGVSRMRKSAVGSVETHEDGARVLPEEGQNPQGGSESGSGRFAG